MLRVVGRQYEHGFGGVLSCAVGVQGDGSDKYDRTWLRLGADEGIRQLVVRCDNGDVTSVQFVDVGIEGAAERDVFVAALRFAADAIEDKIKDRAAADDAVDTIDLPGFADDADDADDAEDECAEEWPSEFPVVTSWDGGMSAEEWASLLAVQAWQAWR